MENAGLKLNIGLAVRISVCQLAIGAWDEIIGSTLQNVLVVSFGKSETFKGVVIAASQLFTLLLLPVWGAMSDRCRARCGRRTPFILTGGFLAAASLALSVVFYRSGNVAGFLACIFAGALGVCIDNPAATALVPDLTPKPLNSDASVVNRLVSALGGGWVILLILLFDTDFTVIYLTVAGTMCNVTLFYLFGVPEKKLVERQKPLLERYNGEKTDEQTSLRTLFGGLERTQKRSFLLLLTANLFAKLAYYAFSSAYLNYAVTAWGMKYAHTSVLSFILYLSGLFALLLTARVARRLTRKKTLLLSYLLMLLGFLTGSLMTRFGALTVLSLLLLGVGWSMESVLPLPMLMELSGSGTVGIVTSLYTDSCKLGRVAGPLLTGFLLDRSGVGYRALYPFAAAAMLPAILCVPSIRHGNVRTPEEVKHEPSV